MSDPLLNFLRNRDLIREMNQLKLKQIKNEITGKIRSKYTYILSSENNNNDVAMFRSFYGIKRHIETLLVMLDETEPENIEDLRQKFVKHNFELDRVSDLKFIDIYPELFEFYAKYSTI